MNVPANKLTLSRILIILVSSFVVVFLIPPLKADWVAERADLAAVVLFALLIAFMIQTAANRRQKLFSTVFLELNKLRRIYHLSKNLAAASPRFRSWFTELHGLLYAYMSEFSGRTLDQYKQTNGAFRKVSYHIYTLPNLESVKEEVLFGDLLETTSVVAESRQKIKELIDSRLSAYSWCLVTIMLLGFVASIVMSMGDRLAGHLIAGADIAVALLAVDLLWELDSMSSELKAWAKRYVDNVGKLELGGRRE
jgi:hypothetical protein